MSAFWILSVLASGFSAILAYALTLLSGQQGLKGWRCMFYPTDLCNARLYCRDLTKAK